MAVAQKPVTTRRPVEAPYRTVAAEEMHFLDTPTANGVLVTDGNGRVRCEGRGIAEVASADYSVGASDRLILVTTGAADRTVTLPAAFLGREVVVKKVDTGAGAVIVDGDGATVDGQADHRLVLPLNYVHLVCDGTNWHVTGAG